MSISAAVVMFDRRLTASNRDTLKRKDDEGERAGVGLGRREGGGEREERKGKKGPREMKRRIQQVDRKKGIYRG